MNILLRAAKRYTYTDECNFKIFFETILFENSGESANDRKNIVC